MNVDELLTSKKVGFFEKGKDWIINEIKEEYSSEEKGLIGQNILETIINDFENEGAVTVSYTHLTLPTKRIV